MKCAYSAGALVALAKALGHTNPDIFVAASGSTGSMFYYLAQQYDDIERCWTRYLPSSQFIKYIPFPTMRINYLIDTVAKNYLPLNMQNFDATKTKYFVPITDVETGETEFVSNETWFNPYEVMRAATAVPILYNSHVRLGGHSYLDGDFSTSLATLIEKAIAMGAKRILCITNTTPPSMIAKLVVRAYATLLHPALRVNVLKDLQSSQAIAWPKDIKFVSLSPSFPLPAVLYSRSRREIVETYNMGYDDLMGRQKEIDELFS